jgi:glycosyltransferase involved in cell wall biosynthesis
VVLLAYNAAAHLEDVVTDWTTYLDGLQRDYEVLLVNDGSTDQTAALAARLAQKSPRLHLLHHGSHQGEGAALRTAVARACKPLLFYTLCDPRYRPAYLNRLLVEVQQREGEEKAKPLIDVVHVTTGYHAGRPVPWPWRLLGLGWRLLCWGLFNAAPDPLPGWLGFRRHLARLSVRLLFAVRNQDVTCPLRLLRREILARIPLQSDGPFVHAEILAKANFLGHLVSEDIPLGDRQAPVAPPEGRCNSRQFRRDFWRLFWRPDFGPARVNSKDAPQHGDR